MRNAGGKERLRTVGDKALHYARASVEQTCHLPVVEVKLFGNTFGNLPNGDYSHGVVGSADVHDAYH